MVIGGNKLFCLALLLAPLFLLGADSVAETNLELHGQSNFGILFDSSIVYAPVLDCNTQSLSFQELLTCYKDNQFTSSGLENYQVFVYYEGGKDNLMLLDVYDDSSLYFNLDTYKQRNMSAFFVVSTTCDSNCVFGLNSNFNPSISDRIGNLVTFASEQTPLSYEVLNVVSEHNSSNNVLFFDFDNNRRLTQLEVSESCSHLKYDNAGYSSCLVSQSLPKLFSFSDYKLKFISDSSVGRNYGEGVSVIDGVSPVAKLDSVIIENFDECNSEVEDCRESTIDDCFSSSSSYSEISSYC